MRTRTAPSRTNRADVLDQHLLELGADPIFGPQVELPMVMGMLALPDARVAEAVVDKLRGAARCPVSRWTALR